MLELVGLALLFSFFGGCLSYLIRKQALIHADVIACKKSLEAIEDFLTSDDGEDIPAEVMQQYLQNATDAMAEANEPGEVIDARDPRFPWAITLPQVELPPVEKFPVDYANIAPIPIHKDAIYLYPEGYLSPKCGHQKCENSPTHYLKLHVDYEMTGEPDVTIVVGVGLCLAHLDVPVEQVATRCTEQMLSLGIGRVHVDALTLSTGIIGDEDWKTFLAKNAEYAGGGRA